MSEQQRPDGQFDCDECHSSQPVWAGHAFFIERCGQHLCRACALRLGRKVEADENLRSFPALADAARVLLLMATFDVSPQEAREMSMCGVTV